MSVKYQEYIKTPTESITITPNVVSQEIDVTYKGTASISSLYTEVNTSAGMDAVNVDANIGKLYKYTGTTDSKYTNGRLYLVEEKPFEGLTFTANTAGSTVSMSVDGTPTLGQNFSYSTDNSTWNTFTPGTTTVTLSNVGDKVYFKGNNLNGVSESNSIYYKFVMTGSISASGNIMSLIDNGDCNTLTIPNSYCFNELFYNCISLTSAPSLPATTLADRCYASMFYYTSLATAPELPATILATACYGEMFSYCFSLTTPPSLPATTLATQCYTYMFRSCTSLTTAPSLPATTLADYCYNCMFHGCTALTTAPSLPATTLVSSCYACMFQNCTSLTSAPSLPATTLADRCYASMFKNCTGLTTAVSLPATTAGTYCYFSMFDGCTSLTTPPSLPATTLASTCYVRMFYGCTSLYVSDTSGTGYDKEWVIPKNGTASGDYTMSNMFYDCLGTRSSDSPNFNGVQKTYYTQNTPV